MNRATRYVWSALLSALASTALALEVPALQARVNDDAGILSANAEARIDATLEALETDTGAQVVVLTIESLGDEVLEEYSLRVAETWELGRADQDDGALLLIAKRRSKDALRGGYGLEPTLTDIMTKRILDQILRPSFRAGDFDGGVERAIGAVDGLIRGTSTLPPPDPSAVQGDMPPRFFGVLWLAFLIPFVSGVIRHQPVPVVPVSLLGALRFRGRAHRGRTLGGTELRRRLAYRRTDPLGVHRAAAEEAAARKATAKEHALRWSLVFWRRMVLRGWVFERRRFLGWRRQLRRRRLVEQLVARSATGVALQAPVPVDPVGPGFGDRRGGVDAERDHGQPLGLDGRTSKTKACLPGSLVRPSSRCSRSRPSRCSPNWSCRPGTWEPRGRR